MVPEKNVTEFFFDADADDDARRRIVSAYMSPPLKRAGDTTIDTVDEICAFNTLSLQATLFFSTVSQLLKLLHECWSLNIFTVLVVFRVTWNIHIFIITLSTFISIRQDVKHKFNNDSTFILHI